MGNKVFTLSILVAFSFISLGFKTISHNQYEFPILKLKYGGVVLDSETSTSRAVRVLVTSCVKNATLAKPVKNKKFKIETLEKIDGSSNNYVTLFNSRIENTFTKKTDSRGCFNFRDIVQHEWYIPERTYIKPFRVTDPETGESHILKIAINPWNTSWLFARDYREIDINDAKKKGEKFPELLITHIRFDSMGVNYSINNYLHLSVVKKYNISLSPLVIRHDSLSEGNFGGRRLRDGKYMLVLSLTHSSNSGKLEQGSFISSVKKIVEVKNGNINVQVEFLIRNLKLMGSRNYMAIEIVPVNENKIAADNFNVSSIEKDNVLNFNSGLISNTFYGSFVPMLNHQGINLIKSENISAYKIANHGLQKMETDILSFSSKLNKPTFLRKNKLKEVFIDNNNSLKWISGNNRRASKALSESIFNETSQISNDDLRTINKQLCSLWPKNIFSEQFGLKNRKIGIGFYKSCLAFLNDNYQPFNVNKSLFIDKTEPKSLKYLGGTSFNYMVGSNFSLYKSDYKDSRKTHTSDVGFSASTGMDWKIFNFSVKRGESYSAAEGTGKALGNSENLNYGSGAYLVIQKSNFEIKATKYDSCLMIKPNEVFLNTYLRTDLGSSASLDDIHINQNFIRNKNSDSYQSQMSDKQLKAFRNFGILLCSSKKFTRATSIYESYYYVTQHFLAGDMHDPYSIQNRPWLMSIRSKSDFISFLKSIRQHNNLSNVGELKYTPVDNLIESYADYNNKTPSWPGLYIYPNYKNSSRVNSQKCNNEKSMFDDLLSSFTEILKGPLKEKDGRNILFKTDFWQIFYCSEK